MEKLKEIRKNNGISQKEFASYMSVAQNTVSRWENGERLMDSDTLKRAAEYFGVSVDYLLGNQAIKFTKKKITTDENTLLIEFAKLNDLGKREAVKRVSELTHISAYSNAAYPVAAHIEANVTKKELELMQQDIDEL